VQPGFSVLFESGHNVINIENIIEEWGGKYLETNHADSILKYSVSNKISKTDITQHASIQIKSTLENKESDAEEKLSILIEVELMVDDDDDPENNTRGIPRYHNLRPQAIIPSLIDTGNWYRNGILLSTKPKKVEYDEVEEWWDIVLQEVENLPQVIIGFDLHGDLPSRNPNYLSRVLSGFANVHYPASAATMELMNEVMGRLKAPRGSIRVLLDGTSKQPLYTPKRIDNIEKVRPYELDIFLRLAKKSVNNYNLDWNDKQIQPSAIKEEYPRDEKDSKDISEKEIMILKIFELEKNIDVIEDAYHSIERENNINKVIIEQLKESEQDLESDIEDLQNQNNGYLSRELEYRESLKKRKKEINHYKKLMAKNKEEYLNLMPILKKYASQENLQSVDELIEKLNESLFEKEDEEEINEEKFESVETVMKYIRDDWEHKNKFIISKSAVNSAKESQFTTPRRVMEAFEMMSRCYDKILNKMKSNQKRVIYAEIFRSDLSDTTFAIANSENSTTMKNFGDLRKFPIEGKDIEMQAHVKIGNGRSSAKCLRIYFIFDIKTEKYLIGYCGRHLPTGN